LLEALAEAIIVKSRVDQADPIQEASTVRLPAEDSSSITSEGGSTALRLRELEGAKKRAEREERRAGRGKEGYSGTVV